MLNIMSMYDPKHGQMHQFKGVRLILDGTAIKLSSINPGKEPTGTPIKSLSWKGEVEVGIFPNPHIVNTVMTATYMLYRGFTMAGGFIRVKNPKMGEFLFDFRHIQSVVSGKKGTTLKIYQVAEHKTVGIPNPVQGEFTMVMGGSDIERFGQLIQQVDQAPDMQNKERCGFCQAVKTLWLQEKDARACPFCLSFWSGMVMALGSALEKAMEYDKQSLQFSMTMAQVLKVIADKMPMRDPLILADLTYAQAFVVYLLIFQGKTDIASTLAEPRARENLEKVCEKLEEAYKAAKMANQTEGISIYGYQLGRVCSMLKRLDRAVELLEESSRMDAEGGKLENFVKSENDVMILFSEMKKYDPIFIKYRTLHAKPEFIALTTPHPMRIMHLVLESAIETNNPEIFGMALADLSAYAIKKFQMQDAGVYATLDWQGRWNEARGDFNSAWDVYVEYLEIGLKLNQATGPEQARKLLDNLRGKVDPARVAAFDQKFQATNKYNS